MAFERDNDAAAALLGMNAGVVGMNTRGRSAAAAAVAAAGPPAIVNIPQQQLEEDAVSQPTQPSFHHQLDNDSLPREVDGLYQQEGEQNNDNDDDFENVEPENSNILDVEDDSDSEENSPPRKRKAAAATAKRKAAPKNAGKKKKKVEIVVPDQYELPDRVDFGSIPTSTPKTHFVKGYKDAVASYEALWEAAEDGKERFDALLEAYEEQDDLALEA